MTATSAAEMLARASTTEVVRAPRADMVVFVRVMVVLLLWVQELWGLMATRLEE